MRTCWLAALTLLIAPVSADTSSNVTPSTPTLRTPATASDAGEITATDDAGLRIQLHRPAQRIVTLSPHATELVFAAGAGDRLIAVAPYSDYPAAATKLPAIGGFGGLDRERLLALAPDLVVAWLSGNAAADLAWLADQGIPVYHSEPRALADIAKSLRDLGRLAGTQRAGEQAAESYQQSLANACPELPSGHRLSAFLQLGAQPLLTVGGGHWLDRALAHAGLRNVYADQADKAIAITPESRLSRQPQVSLYLAYPDSLPPENHLPGTISIALDARLWSRPGPRLPTGLKQLCHQLHATRSRMR